MYMMCMCDCFIYAMIASATYLLKVRADAVRLTVLSVRTRHTQVVYYDSIRFHFISVL